MIVRACIDCDPRASGWWRCRLHQRVEDRQRGTRTQRGYTNAWLRLSRALVAAHVARFGWVCPGWQRPPHPSHDLTADHRVPLARGGSVADGVDVLCRSCNGAKGAALTGAGSGSSERGFRFGTERPSHPESPSKPNSRKGPQIGSISRIA